jgi:hypothetical protein
MIRGCSGISEQRVLRRPGRLAICGADANANNGTEVPELSLAVKETENGSESATTPRTETRQPSKLIHKLFEHLDTSRPLTVLEVGCLQPETVEFFSRYRCRIYVPDLFSELRAGNLDAGISGKTLQRQFQELLAFEPGSTLDVCLLWDFPHYLNEKQLRAFSSALWPWLHPNSRAHAFGVHSAATTLLNREYGIVDQHSISVRTRTSPQLKNSPHPQSFMSEWLTCFSTTSGVLLPDGKVETVMRATVM